MGDFMNKKLLAFCFVMIMMFSENVYGLNLHDDYDVVIAGGGTGGISAAIQAHRMGVSVLVVESSNLIGGQAVAAGVSTMDDYSNNKSGIYLEFMEKIQEYYSSRGKDIKTCYWDYFEDAFEPSIGHKFLLGMAENIDILYQSEIIAVTKSDSKISSVIINSPSGKKNITCRILIDATEYGDIIPLTGTNYRSGNSQSPNINNNAMIQDITWTAIIRKYPNGIPNHLRPKNPLPDYERAKFNYQEYVTNDGFSFDGTFPVKQPVNFITHNAYRGIPDSFTPGNYDSKPENWPLISKSSVNWGNDYPGQYKWHDNYGLPVEYLENKSLRKRIERDALIKTLHFIYYIQNELNQNWSVDENEYNYLPEAAKDLPEEWKNIARHLPPIPYIRESRRIISKHTLTSEEIHKNSLSYHKNNKNNEIHNAIAIGHYDLDLHHAKFDSDMDMNEKEIYSFTHNPEGNFQVPLDIMIDSEIKNFIAAEKNLSMSRLASGALRLQPITMMTGQAAGVLAALSVIEGKMPVDVKTINVQRTLLDYGVDLSLCNYADVGRENKFYGSIQLCNLYNLLEPLSYPDDDNDLGVFGVDELISESDIAKLIERAKID